MPPIAAAPPGLAGRAVGLHAQGGTGPAAIVIAVLPGRAGGH